MIIRIAAAAAAVFALSATGSAAQMITFADMDKDGSGGLALAEVQAFISSATAEDFKKHDADASGELSKEEFGKWFSPGSQPGGQTKTK